MNKIYDEVLSKLQNTEDEIVWGDYKHTYDWFWSDGRPNIIPTNTKNAAQVLIRDWDVARKLKELGVKKVMDIGSDTGHFIAVLAHLGIESVGVDADSQSCQMINKKGVNNCYCVGIQTIVKNDISGYDCIVCMNITHAKWKDEKLKYDLINWMARNAKYVVLSDYTHQDMSWSNLEKIHDFNFLRIYCSKFFIRIADFFGFGGILSYSCIQKLYKSKFIK